MSLFDCKKLRDYFFYLLSNMSIIVKIIISKLICLIKSLYDKYIQCPASCNKKNYVYLDKSFLVKKYMSLETDTHNYLKEIILNNKNTIYVVGDLSLFFDNDIICLRINGLNNTIFSLKRL